MFTLSEGSPDLNVELFELDVFKIEVFSNSFAACFLRRMWTPLGYAEPAHGGGTCQQNPY